MTEKTVTKNPRGAGRPVGSTTNRSLRQTKMKQVLDIINPLLAKALKKAEDILDAPLGSKDVSTTTQLAAVKLIVDKSIELREIVFSKEKDQAKDPDDDEPVDESDKGAILQFTVVGKDDKK